MTLLTRRWSRLPETGRVLQRGAAVSFVSTLGVLVFAGPAMATYGHAELKEAHKNTMAADFQQECDPDGLTPAVEGQDGWHFVLPSRGGDARFASVTLTYRDADGRLVEEVTLEPQDGIVGNGAAAGKHAVHYTPAGYTLVDGSAQVMDDGANSPTTFNLSHTCAGDAPKEPEKPGKPDNPNVPDAPDGPEGELPDDVKTPQTPEESAVVDKPAEKAPESKESEESEEQQLPVTGVAIGGIVLTGLGLVGAGVALRASRRKGDDPDESSEE